jgi:LEA14-like dessication related protein
MTRLSFMPRSLLVSLAALAVLLVGACATPRPFVSVVGASQTTVAEARSLIVVVEIHNPTRTPIELSTLEYTLKQAGTDRGGGRVTLEGTVAPGGSLTVDIAVPVSGGMSAEALDLRGKLRGFAGDVQVNWSIAADGVGKNAVIR